ncbi:MAG: bifunctional demethylmenaquinone methyltransferase/2-methoxy-6-polyprenyl-1,4-benzoquinol methylase UbiE [Parvibaculaceae bacterium]
MQDEREESVTFGSRRVAAADRQGLVNEVFAKVADRYDQMNDLMSGGLHRLWKDDLVAMLNPPKNRPFRVLDVAGGTGDVASRILKCGGPRTEVVMADISDPMLSEGRRRIGGAGLSGRCRFAVANAETLPFPDRGFDAYTIAFGIRNVTRIERALEEAFRVLKVGGRFLCMEFSHTEVPGLGALYDTYSQTAIPAMGKLVTGDGASYRYLVESIKAFPNQARFAVMVEKAGFSRVAHRNLMGGIVAIHSGWRI